MTATTPDERFALIQAEASKVKLEFLELDAEIAEVKRAYLVDGVSTSPARRAELYAKSKALTVELFKFNVLERQEKIAMQRVKAKSLLRLLIGKVEAAGLGRLVQEASEESLAALSEAGMLKVYETA